MSLSIFISDLKNHATETESNREEGNDARNLFSGRLGGVDVNVLFPWYIEESLTLAFGGIISPREATLWSFYKEIGPQKPPADFITHLTCLLSGKLLSLSVPQFPYLC